MRNVSIHYLLWLLIGLFLWLPGCGGTPVAPSPRPTSTPAPTVAFTPTRLSVIPTSTSTVTPTAIPTVTPTPTSTPTVTPSPTASFTSTPSATFSPTPSPLSPPAGDTPSPTATVPQKSEPAYRYYPLGPAQPELSQPCPGCPRAPGYIIGRVVDQAERPLAGVRLVCYNDWHHYPVVGTKGNGEYDFQVIQAEATWRVVVLDEADQPLSPEMLVHFDPLEACWYRLDWQRVD